MFDLALNDIRALYEGGISRTGWAGCIRKDDVVLWANENNLSIEHTFDGIGVALACAYANGSLDWDFCDSAANDLFGVLMLFHTDSERHVGEPKLFWKYYLAFDHSETVEPSQADETARAEIGQFLSELPVTM
jgi:hypothetical protein